MLLLKIALVLVASLAHLVGGYKVLLFFPFPGKSHSILAEGYVRNLVKAGHNVTYVTPVPVKHKQPNLRQIDVSSNFENFPFAQSLDIKKVLENEVNIKTVDVFYKAMHFVTDNALRHEKVQQLFLDTNEEFDVAIVQWLYSDLNAGVPAVFNCPMIWSSTMEPHPMVLRLIDDIPNPAYAPDHVSPVDTPMSFSERIGELWSLLYTYKVRWNQANAEIQTYMEAYGPAFLKRGRQIPSFDDVRFNGSLMFGNSHVSIGLAVRLPQNYIPIAGYHIKNEIPPLPEDLKEIMDTATHGVIYFSLGSMMKGKTMPPELKARFLKTFSQLKQVVIWKLEEQQTNLPKNVHIVEWAPQQTILAHPNTVLFITHGGLLSTTETLHYGVPVIGIPLFADQFLNIRRAVNKGYGIHVPLTYNTPVELKAAMENIIENPKYRERAKELSALYHDRPIPPSVEMVHWVEHVAKTRGALYLRSPALMMPWYQKMYLDLFTIVVIGVYIVVILVKRLVSLIKIAKTKKD